MSRALIGYTGFVGRNLLETSKYTHLYNSKNINEIEGRDFDEIICCGVSAVKWWANQNPYQDWENIEKLLHSLKSVSSKSFILISTIDVYPNPNNNFDESEDLKLLDNHTYGKNRLKVEEFISSKFSNSLIIRLPALFGNGLKKNIIYDLLNDNQIEKINPLSEFQWYPVSRLENDINMIKKTNINLINLFTQPLKTIDIIKLISKENKFNMNLGEEPKYRLKTKYSDLFGRDDGYILSSDMILKEIKKFMEFVLSNRN